MRNFWTGCVVGAMLGSLYGSSMGQVLADGAPAAPLPTAPHFDVPLSAQDSANISQICKFAMDGKELDLATKTAIGQFCLDLLNRIGMAQSAARKDALSKPAPATVTPSEGAPK